MKKNTGESFEKQVYKIIYEMVNKNEFMISFPNVKIRRKPRYYSKDRDAEIEFDVSVEKYLGNPDENRNMRPSIIVIIECKDYSKSIPVDDVEEFHAKLQQVGADNTKGIMITQKGCFQRSALTYAESKGIALARILPSAQVHFIECTILESLDIPKREMTEEEIERQERERREKQIKPLIEKGYISCNDDFFSLPGDFNLESLIFRFLGINYSEYRLSDIKKYLDQ